jgi:DNA-binding beta-propeller fold protein YncE
MIASATLRGGSDDRQSLERIAAIDSKGVTGALDHLFVDSKSSRLFLANQSNNTLDVVDVKKNQLLQQIPEQKAVHGVVYVPDGDRLIVGSGGACNIFDGTTYRSLKSIPHKGADSVRFDPRTNHVLVTGQNGLAVIDAKTLEPLATVKLPGSPHGLQVGKKHPRVYVNTGPPNQVAVVDTDKNEVVARYPLGGDSKGIGPLALDEANGRILVGLRAQPRLAVLDLDSGKAVATAPLPESADDMFVDAEAKRIYVSCGSGFIAVLRQVDADHYESVANVPTVKGAKTSFFDPALRRLYLAVPRQEGKEGPEIWVYQARP